AIGLIVRGTMDLRDALGVARFNEEEQKKANQNLEIANEKVQQESKKALEEGVKAAKSAEERRQALSRSRIIDAGRAQQDGDVLASLPWLGEALVLDRDDATREPEHRLRLGSALSISPQLLQLFFHKGQVSYAGFTPDGKKLLTASWDKTASLWD